MRDLLLAIMLSAFFSALKFIGSLLHICGRLRWVDFLGGVLTLFIFFILWRAGHTLYYMHLYKKDPIFMEAHMRTGISWWDYKRLRNKDCD